MASIGTTKYGLSRAVIENFLEGKVWVSPDPRHSVDSEERFLAIGRSPDGRPMFVAFTFRLRSGRKLIRPISARFMHAKEARKYEQAFAKDEK